MSNRQVVLGFVGIALIATGLLALWFPVYLSQYDHYGMQISCGRGFGASLAQAGDVDGAGFVTKCGTALLIRRTWAIPSTVIGCALLAVVLAAWVRAKPDAEEESTRFWELNGDAT